MKHNGMAAALLAATLLLAGCAPGAGDAAQPPPPLQLEAPAGQALPADSVAPVATAPEEAQPMDDEARAYAAVEKAGQALGLPLDGYTSYLCFENLDDGALLQKFEGEDGRGLRWTALRDAGTGDLRSLRYDEPERVHAALRERGTAFDGLDESILTDYAPYASRAQDCAALLCPAREVDAIKLRGATMEDGMPRVELNVFFRDGYALLLKLFADADKTPYGLSLYPMRAEELAEVPAVFSDGAGNHVWETGERDGDGFTSP